MSETGTLNSTAQLKILRTLIIFSIHNSGRSGHGAVVSVLVLQSWSHWFNPLLLQSFG